MILLGHPNKNIDYNLTYFKHWTSLELQVIYFSMVLWKSHTSKQINATSDDMEWASHA